MKVEFQDLLADVRRQLLTERLTFDQLVGFSDPKRITRSQTVKVPPLHFDAYKDAEIYYFNVKSAPSTTGLRHKGMIKCYKPKDPNTPLEKCECEVDCTCQDYRYRWAWSNKQRGSGRVGAQSFNQAWNKAPRIMNPVGRPGVCKHILALRDWIYGKLRSFAAERPYDSTTSRLDKLVQQSARRWANMPAELAKAKERDTRIRQGILQRSQAQAAKAKEPSLPDRSSTPSTPAVLIRPTPAVRASVPAIRATRPETPRLPVESAVVSGMMNLVEEVDHLITQATGAPVVAADRKGGKDEVADETLTMLREIRDLVRHLAKDDLPPDFAAREGEEEQEKKIEPGIPADAVKAREET